MGGGGNKDVPYCSSSYLAQLNLVRTLVPIHKTTVHFKAKRSGRDRLDGDAIRLLKEIATEHRTTVTIDNGYSISADFFEELSKIPNASTTLSPSKLKIRLKVEES